MSELIGLGFGRGELYALRIEVSLVKARAIPL